jgi:pyridinium-3,5-biscarboxylic acid mononucleotide sulfurtransferase
LCPIMETDTTSHSDPVLSRREADLDTWLQARERLAIGFSGGVDSAYLGVAARLTLGPDRVLAIIGRSASYPEAQWAVARDVARSFDVPVLELETAELDDPRYAANPSNRCYFCKSELWTKLVPVARAHGFEVVADGTNADDLSDWRPGAQAAREHGVASPLADLGFTKQNIRDASRRLGIPTWRQPSSPCLSSRLPYGIEVTRARLEQIERAEEAVRALGVAGDLRVRYHEDLARVELGPDELPHWMEPSHFESLREALLATGFARVALDLRGFRSGSLNVLHGVAP